MTEPDRILRLNAVLDLTGLSRSTLYRKLAEGSFPRHPAGIFQRGPEGVRFFLVGRGARYRAGTSSVGSG